MQSSSSVLVLATLALTHSAGAQCPGMEPPPPPPVISKAPGDGGEPSIPQLTPTRGAPALPAPSTATPQVPNPITPRANPGGVGARGPVTPRGTPLVFTRRATSQKRLRVDWAYPVPELGEQAMSYSAALRRIRGDDRRPMIVLRECAGCKGTDFALLSRTLDNEKTLTLTRFFHCVKLPNHVVQDSHPFHALFEGEAPPHLFLLASDSEERIPLSGEQKQGDLWKVMNRVLGRSYEKSADPSVRSLLALLDRFDHLDARETELQEQLDRAIVASGPTSTRVKKLLAKLNRIRADKTEALTREKELADLKLRPKS